MAFGFYTSFPVDHTKVGASDSSNFPVMIAGSDARFKSAGNGGHVQSSSGFDLRPYADTGAVTAKTYELVSYNATLGTFELWYKEPTLSHTVDTPCYLFYGDASISTNGSSTSTWSNGFAGVYHFGDGSTLDVHDSGPNGVNGTNSGYTESSGLMSGGISSDGTGTKMVSLGTGSAINTALNGATFTVDLWINNSNLAGLLFGERGSTNARCIALGVWVTNAIAITDENNAVIGSVPYTSTGAWTKISYTYNSGSNHVFVNAVDNNIGSYTYPGSFTGTYVIGSNFSGEVAGVWDEVRVSTASRSADWIMAEYNNQNAPSTFNPMGTEVAVGAGGTVTTSLIAVPYARNIALNPLARAIKNLLAYSTVNPASPVVSSILQRRTLHDFGTHAGGRTLRGDN